MVDEFNEDKQSVEITKEKTRAEMLTELSAFYLKEIKSKQNDINKNRRIYVIRYFLFLIAFMGLIILPLIPVLSLVLFVVIFIIFILQDYIGGAYDTWNRFGSDYGLKLKFMSKFLSIFGENIKYENVGFSAGRTSQMCAEMNRYRNLGIINPYLILTPDDNISGQYNGVNFKIQEACTSLFSANNFIIFLLIAIFVVPMLFCLIPLTLFFIYQISGSKIPVVTAFLGFLIFVCYKFYQRVPFRGILVEFDMNKVFKGETIIVERAKTTRGLKINKTKLQEVVLEDPEFMKKYVVYSSNQIEARYLLTTSFIERFNNIQFAFKPKFIRANFKDKKVSLAINTGRDLFTFIDFFKDTDAKTITSLFDELYSVLNLIESFKLNQKLGL